MISQLPFPFSVRALVGAMLALASSAVLAQSAQTEVAPSLAQPVAASGPAAQPLVAQPFVIGNSQVVPIASKHTGRQHELVIILPSSHAAHPERTYPVLYFLDAYWDTPLVSAVYGHLRYDNQIPEMILVGLSYPASANVDQERMIDYAHTVGAGGKSQAFLDFIRSEVAPLIETRYRGSASDRIIGGSSLGGLFSVASAYSAPGFFAAHIGISPAVVWQDEALLKTDAALQAARQPLASRMFVSYGSFEHRQFRQPIERFQRQLAKRPHAGLALQNYVMRDLDHAGVKADGYTRGLIWAWKANKPAGPSGLDRSFGVQ